MDASADTPSLRKARRRERRRFKARHGMRVTGGPPLVAVRPPKRRRKKRGAKSKRPK